MANDTPVIVFDIENYMIIFRQLEKRDFGGVEAHIRGIVRCTGISTPGDHDCRLDVYFLTLDSPVPDPIVNIEERSGAIFLPSSEMALLIDVMRNEKPLYGHLRGDNPQWTSITSMNEPVGVGDEDS